jgi:hypothetical protein
MAKMTARPIARTFEVLREKDLNQSRDEGHVGCLSRKKYGSKSRKN